MEESNGAPHDITTAADLIDLAASGRVYPVDLSGGRRCFVRLMTLAELESFETGFKAETTSPGQTAWMIAATACDKDGRRLFTMDQRDDIRDRMPLVDAMALSSRAMEVNNFTAATETDLKNDSGTTTENG